MIKAVLFDFDGVLGDSYKVTFRVLNEVLQKFNFPTPDEETFLQYRGLPRRQMTEVFLPKSHGANIEEMEEYFHQLSIKWATEITLISGARKLLDDLKDKYKLAVVSSRGKDTLVTILKHHNIHDYFTILIHKESVKEHKPHPEGLLKVLEILQLQQDEVIFIGDAKEDVGAAKNAGIISVLLGKENVHNADYHIKSLNELPKILKQL